MIKSIKSFTDMESFLQKIKEGILENLRLGLEVNYEEHEQGWIELDYRGY